MDRSQCIIALAKKAFEQCGHKTSSDVPRQTRNARYITKTWEEMVNSEISEKILNSSNIRDGIGSFALLDCDINPSAAYAYEIIISPNNPADHILKTYSKILIYNQSHPEQPIKKVSFILNPKIIKYLNRKTIPPLSKNIMEYFNNCENRIEYDIVDIAAK